MESAVAVQAKGLGCWFQCSTKRWILRRRSVTESKEPRRMAFCVMCPNQRPTYASWLNQVERWFATLTEKYIRRGTHRSTRQLETAIKG